MSITSGAVFEADVVEVTDVADMNTSVHKAVVISESDARANPEVVERLHEVFGERRVSIVSAPSNVYTNHRALAEALDSRNLPIKLAETASLLDKNPQSQEANHGLLEAYSLALFHRQKFF